MERLGNRVGQGSLDFASRFRYEAGPITQGWRLSTYKTPSAGFLIYPKGGYVLHMLRMQMYDWSSKDPDARFIEMMPIVAFF